MYKKIQILKFSIPKLFQQILSYELGETAGTCNSIAAKCASHRHDQTTTMSEKRG
jgi:hypothetical protein